MITDYIKRSGPGAAFFSLFILIVFRVVYLVVGHTEISWALALPTLVPVLGTGILLSVFCDRFDLLPERTHWTLVTYVWLMAMCPQTYVEWEAVLSSVLITAALYRLIVASLDPHARSNPFLSAFYITCAGLLFRPAFLFYIPLIIGFLLMTETSVKNLFAFVGGIVVPLLLLIAGLWFLGYSPYEFGLQRIQELGYPKPVAFWKSYSVLQLVPILVLIVLVLLALFARLLRRESTTTIYVWRFYNSMFLFFVFAAAVFLLYPNHANGVIALFMIPTSFLITSLFSEKRFFGSRVWLSLFILSSLVYFVARLDVLPLTF